ncbi:MAG: bifunctional diaminohydroxyphosphoribosylaminopyrimidine deaminase/5-amino-6-(5-phosphoribosylamino)uracil reductase RibD [Bacteroidota bacterium]
MINPSYMHRCIELARNRLGYVAPNPMVGCVIVNEGTIIGEGCHQKFGEAHAEVNAINSIPDKALLKTAALYVNLEPCCYFGKTPPCTDLIIRHEIPRVIIGCIDPAPRVSGKGIEKLKRAGCNVTVGILENEAKELNRRFFTFHEKKRPYIILKWAQTLDGFISPGTASVSAVKEHPGKADQVWISNELSRTLVHKWRSQEQAIMVGTNTALLDDPQLNVREWSGNNPLRLVLDRSMRLPEKLNLFDRSIPTIIFTATEKKSQSNIEYVVIDFKDNIAEKILYELYKKNISSVIIEGGRQLLNTFIEGNQWDEARVFISNENFKKGLKAPLISEELISKDDLGNDQLFIYRNSC